MSEEKKIPTIEEMKEEAFRLVKDIPLLKEKYQLATEIRGQVIEFSIIIERSLNELITKTGKEMVFDNEKKELYLIAGIRPKKDLPGFTTKTRDMIKLIEKIFPKLDKVSKDNLLDAFNRFKTIRDIFAHVPVNWQSKDLEFDDNIPYKHFFKLEPKWKNMFFSLSEFMGLHKWIMDVILSYNRHILIQKELIQGVLFGPNLEELQKEMNKLKENEKH